MANTPVTPNAASGQDPGSFCIDNAGYTEASCQQAKAVIKDALYDSLAQLAVAFYRRLVFKRMKDMEYNLAKRWQRMSRAMYLHARKFWGYESRFINDTFNTPQPIADYRLGPIYKEGSVNGQFDSIRSVDNVLFHTELSNATPPEKNFRLMNVNILNETDAGNVARRAAEFRASALAILRYQRQSKVIAAGRDILSSINPQMGNLSAIMHSMGEQLWGLGDQASYLIGYAKNNYGNNWSEAFNNARRGMDANDAARWVAQKGLGDVRAYGDRVYTSMQMGAPIPELPPRNGVPGLPNAGTRVPRMFPNGVGGR